MSITDRAVDSKHYVTFHAARRFLEAKRIWVTRTQYDYSLYFVAVDGNDYICNMWDVIDMAEERGFEHE